VDKKHKFRVLRSFTWQSVLFQYLMKTTIMQATMMTARWGTETEW